MTKDDEFATLSCSQCGLVELAALVFYWACIHITKAASAEKQARKEPVPGLLKDELMNGKWLLYVSFPEVDAALVVLANIISCDTLNACVVPQDVWDLQLFEQMPSMVIIGTFFHQRKNLLRAALGYFNFKECSVLNECMVILLATAVYAICAGCSPLMKYFKKSPISHPYLDVTETGDDWVQMGDHQHRRQLEHFGCFVEVLANKCLNSSFKISASTCQQSFCLLRQLRDPLMQDVENYICGLLISKDSENRPLSEVLFMCALLSNFVYGSLVTSSSHFYVTGRDRGKQDIHYYRKSVWKMFAENAITCWKDYKSSADVKSIIAGGPFGFSKLRLCPQVSGVKMLANLKATSRILADDSCSKVTFPRMQKNIHWPHKRFKIDNGKSMNGDFLKSVNSVLHDTYAVLKGLLSKEHVMLGSSVFDYYDVYRKLCPFLTGLKNGMNDIPGVFIVVSDDCKAFDSVYHHQLLGIIDDVMMDNNYIVKKFHQIGCPKKSLSVQENLTLDQSFYPYYTKSTLSFTFHSLHSITVNQVFRVVDAK